MCVYYFDNIYINIHLYFYPDQTSPPPPEFVFDENVMSELTQMGFPHEACKRAIFFTKNRGLNDATYWLMEHISDSDFSDPFIPPGTDSG